MKRALALAAVIGVGPFSSAWAQSASNVPQVQVKRTHEIDFSSDFVYDSNIAHGNEAQAIVRGIHPEDETARPRITFNIVQPLSRQALFLTGFAGYDFHRLNKQLDHLNTDLTGGAALTVGPCHGLPFGNYVASQSNPEDVVGGTARNLLTTVTGSVQIQCGRATGLQEQVLYQHSKAYNTNGRSEVANHTSDSITGGLAYANRTLGDVGLEAGYSRTEFPNRILPSGAHGDAFSVATFGATYSRLIGTKIKATADVSDALVQRKNAPPGGSKNTSGINYSAQVLYQMNRNLGITVQGSRAYKPSNQPGRLFELLTGWQMDTQYQLGSRIVLGLGASYKDSRTNVDSTLPVALPTRYHQIAGYGSASYRFSRRLGLSLEVRQEDKTTDIPTFDYSDTRVTLSLDVSL
jgi:hypothetical protein